MERISVPPARIVNVTCNQRSWSVRPSAWNRFSIALCSESTRTINGCRKKTCSISACVTPCFSFLRAFPSSQSNPTIWDRSTSQYMSDIYKTKRESQGFSSRSDRNQRHCFLVNLTAAIGTIAIGIKLRLIEPNPIDRCFTQCTSLASCQTIGPGSADRCDLRGRFRHRTQGSLSPEKSGETRMRSFAENLPP